MKLYKWKKLLPAGLSLIFSVHTPRDLKIVAQLDAASRLFAQLLTDKGWSEKNALSAHSGGDELQLVSSIFAPFQKIFCHPNSGYLKCQRTLCMYVGNR
jgi:hypothetical protein